MESKWKAMETRRKPSDLKRHRANQLVHLNEQAIGGFKLEHMNGQFDVQVANNFRAGRQRWHSNGIAKVTTKV